MQILEDILNILIGFRKFIIMIIFIGVMVVFRIYDLIDGSQFAENLQLSIVAFMGSNLGERLIDIGHDWIEKKSPKGGSNGTIEESSESE